MKHKFTIRKLNREYKNTEDIYIKLFIIYSLIVDEVREWNYQVVTNYYICRRFKNEVCK